MGTRQPPAARLALIGLCGLLFAALPAIGSQPIQQVSPAPRAGGPQAANESPAWPQWGGPHRNFMSDVTGLARSWPEAGPPQLWKRELGEGHSSIVVDEGRLYTMYRLWAEEEAVVALDAATGKTIWELRYPSPPLDFSFGAGPHSTPLIVGDRLFTAGTNKEIFALRKRTGEVIWSHDLVREFGAPATLIRPAVTPGFACSPLAYNNMVIVTAGGPGQSVMAFDQADGTVVWRNGDFLIAPSSPILIDVDGQRQLVVVGGQTVNGLDPDTGVTLWSHAHDTVGDMNITTPVWGEGNLLFVSSAYDGGSRVLRLTRTGDETTIEELWFSRRLRVMFGSTIRLGDYIYGSSGDFGPTFITALNINTGQVAWRERGFARASFLYADGMVILLDEYGTLALAKVSPGGLKVLSWAEIVEPPSWTVPTLAGTTLYLRDRRAIMALDVGPRN